MAANILVDTSPSHLVHLLLGPKDDSQQLTPDLSIYSRLKKYLGKSDEHLDPSPEINRLFGELVSYLQGVPNVSGVQLTERFAFLEREACNEIDNDDLLISRANAIRDLACRAESRLERYWAPEIAAGEDITYNCLNPVERINFAARKFPYIQNYIDMVQKEAQVIETQLPELELMNGVKMISVGEKQRRLEIAFCGSGPLPLTGLLLAACLDANVTLIDLDEVAVELSKRLIESWESRGILEKGQVKVICADGGKVRFYSDFHCLNGTTYATPKSVLCDVVFIAALIPNSTKEDIARNISEMRHKGPLLILRSAHGLTARLAYFQNRRDIMTKYLSFVGLVVPCVHELENGSIVDDEVQPIEFFSKEILNSLELYKWTGERTTARALHY